MAIDRLEAEVLIETALGAVSEQYIVPLVLALETLTRVLCVREPDLAETISTVLKSQAESCRQKDAAGFAFLEFLSERAAAPASPLSPDLENSSRTFLRLIEGGKGKNQHKNKDPRKK